MRLQVQKVNGMPFVKVPLGYVMSLYPCDVRLIEGRYGPSLAIFLETSVPEIRKRLDDMEDKCRALIYNWKEKIERMLETHYEHEQIDAVRLIKSDVLWAKCPRRLFPKGHSKASIKLWFHHIFFSESRISISVEAR